MEASKVDLWINGHDHTAQVACSNADGAVTRFVTAGVGGYDLHALVDSSRWHPETVYANNTYHGFTAHRITPNAITTYFLDSVGTCSTSSRSEKEKRGVPSERRGLSGDSRCVRCVFYYSACR